MPIELPGGMPIDWMPPVPEIDREIAKRREAKHAFKSEAGFKRERAAQAQRGGLMRFIKYFWSILEPETELIEGWVLEAICEHLEAITFGDITRLLVNVPPGSMKSLAVDVFWPAWEWGPMGMAHLRYVTFSYSAELTERDNGRFRALLESDRFRSLWGERFTLERTGDRKIVNSRTGWKFASSIGGVSTGERGDRVILDDPHNVRQTESQTVRQETVRWRRESMANRLNDISASAVVIVMQRLHEEDVSGDIIAAELPYCHLMIPMEFDSTRYPPGDNPARYPGNDIGWIDPRALDEDGELLPSHEMEKRDGELAWPERFPQDKIDEMKADLGPFAWAGQYCTPGEAPVLMRDLSMKRIDTIVAGDEVIGFTSRERFDSRRRRLTPATVLSVSKSVQKVSKLRLESGKVIRCTGNHKWYTGRDDETHPTYKSASVGTPLMRVCDPEIEVLTDPDDIRLAGWLAGFFDGEGSVSLTQRRKDPESKAALIGFTQGAGRNLPLCLKLERVLNHFGFDFNYKECVRYDRFYKEGAPLSRQYYIKSASGTGKSPLPALQKFLHVIRPEKWRDRLMEGALTSRFIVAEDRVVSIEDDGTEIVYGLETTTGNYVVWGLASSNSQAPMPRKGGIFELGWWQTWEPPDGNFPRMEIVIGSLDSAFTEKEENDPSGFVVLGIFIDAETKLPKIMLMHAWRKHLRIHGEDVPKEPHETVAAWTKRAMPRWGLVEWVAHTCRRFKADTLLIEAKASGLDVIHEMERLYHGEGWGIVGAEAPRDKVSRALAVQPVFSQEVVYAPARDWAEMVQNEMAMFPKGKRKDLTDAMCHGVKWLRDRGLIKRPSEIAREQRALAQHRKKRGALYPA